MSFSDVLSKQDARGLGRTLASKGNRGDTMLAHINPEEAELLKMMGGSGTVNPKTGLLQFDPIFQPTGRYNEVGEWEEYPLAPSPATPAATSAYLKANPDVAKAGVDPWEHYNQFGKTEGRTWGESPAYYQDYTQGYEQYAKDYRSKYPEDESLIDKMQREARDEEFTPEIKSYQEWLIGDDPKPQSDSDAGYSRYLSKYDTGEGPSESYQSPQQRGMGDKRLSYDEWYDIYKVDAPKEPTKYTSGPGEHLQKTDADYSPPAGWDSKLYLEKNPDLLDDPWAAANPLAHYRAFGEDEGRGRVAGGYDKADFGQARRLYLERNPDVLEQKMDPWEHYELHGKEEGRKWQGEEPKIDFSNARLPTQRKEEVASAIRAVKDGYFIVPQSGATPFATRGEPGERVAVDRYGWMKTPGDKDKRGALPEGSYYNILTNKWLAPEDGKPSLSKKGREMPEGPGTSDWNRFMAANAMSIGSVVKGIGSGWGAPVKGVLSLINSAGTSKPASRTVGYVK